MELKKYKFDWYSPGIRAQLFDTELLKLENDIIIKNQNQAFIYLIPYHLLGLVPLKQQNIF